MSYHDLWVHESAARTAAGWVLRADVERCYRSIYTHAIPWALVGKAKAKADKKPNPTNDLDTLLRRCQDNQTMGIPVGPDASHILAEWVLAAVDRLFLKSHRRPVSGFRYVDDYNLAFRTVSEAEAALASLESALAHFELTLNPGKTRIAPVPDVSEKAWVRAIRDHRIAGRSDKGVWSLVELAYSLAQEYPGESVLAYAIARLSDASRSPGSWPVVLDFLLQAMQIDRSTVGPAAQEIARRPGLSAGERDKVGAALSAVVAASAPVNHGHEVSWALWLAGTLGVSLDRSASTAAGLIDDNASIILALRFRNLLPGLRVDRWVATLATASPLDENWLLSYEVLRDPTMFREARLSSLLVNDPGFKAMAASNVTFLNFAASVPPRRARFAIASASYPST